LDILGITLARGSFKVIKNKNIRLLAGKPLIQYTNNEALKSEYLNHYIFSTDDDGIAIISQGLEAYVPFLRPKKLTSDAASSFSALQNA
jgi:CMP-N-acetylneuraminic acid synthetase